MAAGVQIKTYSFGHRTTMIDTIRLLFGHQLGKLKESKFRSEQSDFNWTSSRTSWEIVDLRKQKKYKKRNNCQRILSVRTSHGGNRHKIGSSCRVRYTKGKKDRCQQQLKCVSLGPSVTYILSATTVTERDPSELCCDGSR